jgi:hypothetical protein
LEFFQYLQYKFNDGAKARKKLESVEYFREVDKDSKEVAELYTKLEQFSTEMEKHLSKKIKTSHGGLYILKDDFI